MLDRTIDALAFFIAALLVTGGVRFEIGTARVELSQVDAFAWVLLAMMAWRRLRRGDLLTPGLARLAESARATLERHPRTALAMSFLVYVALHVWISTWRYDSFRANAWDLGFMAQALWTTARGHGFLVSDMAQGGTYLGEHFSPALSVAALPYLLGDSIRGLFVFQTLVLGSAAWLSYGLGRSVGLDRATAAFAGVVVLLYRPLRAANIFDFREDDLLVPVFFGMLIAHARGRRGWTWALALVSWTVKETAPLFTACLGLHIAFGRQRRREGFVLFGLSVVAFYTLAVIVTARLAGAGETVAMRRLGEFGGSNEAIARYVLEHPLAFAGELAARVFHPQSLRYLAQVGAPFVMFATAAPWAAATALAGALFNVVFVRHGVGFHYECALLPFLVYVLVKGLARWKASSGFTAERLAIVTLSFLLFFGRSPVATVREMAPTARDRRVAAALANLPSDASVVTHAAVYPHVAQRRHAPFLSRNGLDAMDWTADYAVIDRGPGRSLYDTPDLTAVAAALDARGASRVHDSDSLVIWRLRR